MASYWATGTAKRIGEAVKAARNRRGWTAARLSEESATLGFPIHRVAIGKLENGHRDAKFDVTELLVLAQALAVSPVWLLFPDLPDGPVEVLPGQEATSGEAMRWFTGEDIESLGQLHKDLGAPSVTTPMQQVRKYYRIRDELLTLQNELVNVAPGAGADRIIDRQIRKRAELTEAKAKMRFAGLTVEDAAPSYSRRPETVAGGDDAQT